VKINGFYVPVTAAQTWEFAQQFGAWPMTRAVADMTHNFVLKRFGSDFAAEFLSMGAIPLHPIHKGRVDPKTKLPIVENPVYEFELFWDSGLLHATKYMSDSSIHTPGLDQGPLVSGIHKLWLLSTYKSEHPSDKPRAVNYGQYFKIGKAGTKDKPLSNRGPYLDKAWNVFQGPGNKHDNGHWDYSQLLQLMRNVRIEGQAEKVKPDDFIPSVLMAGTPHIWDENDPAHMNPSSTIPLARNQFPPEFPPKKN
jgi:hypothetical protein